MNDSTPDLDIASRIMSCIEALAAISESNDHLTRVSLSEQHKQANSLVGEWMTACGMQVHTDAIGNIIGRYEGSKEGPALLIGSHLDTVRNGGRYDGMLGVVIPIICVEILHKQQKKLPFPIEIVGFCDEEGVRFPSTLLGSRAIAGTLDEETLQECDASGISIAEALREFGQDPDQLQTARRHSEDFIGFVEIHIEQGPVLELEDLPVGLVTAISGASRYQIEVTGKAGHAGTVPMNLREDALTAASECILAIEDICTQLPDVVGTVGMIDALPGAGNVIPGQVNFSLDLRSSKDSTRDDAEAKVFSALERISHRRGVAVKPMRTYQAEGRTCDSWLSNQLASAIKSSGYRLLTLPSGAGHDAMALADLTRIAMLFVRCKDGLSHHPDESITREDAAATAKVLMNLLLQADLSDPQPSAAG